MQTLGGVLDAKIYNSTARIIVYGKDLIHINPLVVNNVVGYVPKKPMIPEHLTPLYVVWSTRNFKIPTF